MKNVSSQISILFAFMQVLNFSSAASAQSQAPEQAPQINKKFVKESFKSVPAEVRTQLLERGQIFTAKYNPDKVQDINLLADLQKSCGLEYKVTDIEVEWPKTQCRYHADTEKSMGGGSSKFLCDFPDDQKVKIKYAPQENPFIGESEVVETILGSSMARLIGFPTNRYCPAELTCVDCPNSDPWNNKTSSGLFKRSTDHGAAQASPGRMATFKYALIEDPLSAYAISVPNDGKAPSGVLWRDLKTVSANVPTSEKRQMLIDREAMMLWIHFIMNPDAGNFNNRLSCPKSEVAEDSTTHQISCGRPVVYVHDYGHAFFEHFQFGEYVKNPILVNDTKRGGCYGILGEKNVLAMRKGSILTKPEERLILNARISSEARDELVQRLKRITNEQWATMYKLARIDHAMKARGGSVSMEDWINGMHKQIQTMEAAQCLPFDEGSSVLGERSAQ